MLSDKIKDYLTEYISQEVYVQVALAKGKNKVSTKAAIEKYFESNHFARTCSRQTLQYFFR
jgi:hypothetical protein